MGDSTGESASALNVGELERRARIDRCIEFIAAAVQVPSFLIAGKSDDAGKRSLADPLYEDLVRTWLDTAESAPPSPEMDAFVFALASALGTHLYCDEQLSKDMALRGYRTRGWLSDLRYRIMTTWLQMTPISQIATLASSWLRTIDAENDQAATGAEEDNADRRAAVAWQSLHMSPGRLLFGAARSSALAAQATTTAANGWCGHRSP